MDCASATGGFGTEPNLIRKKRLDGCPHALLRACTSSHRRHNRKKMRGFCREDSLGGDCAGEQPDREFASSSQKDFALLVSERERQQPLLLTTTTTTTRATMVRALARFVGTNVYLTEPADARGDSEQTIHNDYSWIKIASACLVKLQIRWVLVPLPLLPSFSPSRATNQPTNPFLPLKHRYGESWLRKGERREQEKRIGFSLV